MKKLLCLFLLCISMSALAQDYNYAYKCLYKLTDREFGGRGYVNDGGRKAAKWIADELRSDGLTLMGENGMQYFDVSINNINSMSLRLHSKDSVKEQGVDYLVHGLSSNSYVKLENRKALVFKDKEHLRKYGFRKLEGKVILFDQKILSYRDLIYYLRDIQDKGIKPELIVVQGYDKITYPISTVKADFPVLLLKGTQFEGKKIDYLELEIKSEYFDKYQTQNVWAKVEGTKYKDSCIVITSHYDHIGMCGDAMFPGSLDNASGCCVTLGLAKYYAAHPQEYTLVFVYFSGEEIGLYGSKYAADFPLVDMTKIKFLVNLDMCGSGSEGIAVVNGKNVPLQANLLTQINSERRSLFKIDMLQNSCNSDHCPFVQKGVPGIFIYTYGQEDREYHTVYDTPERIPFTKYVDLCETLKEFFTRLQKL